MRKLLVAGVLISLAAYTQAAQIWDLANDFHTDVNAGTWTYFYGDANVIDGNYTLMESNANTDWGAGLTTGLPAWHSTVDIGIAPYLVKNTLGGTIVEGAYAGEVYGHPWGPSTKYLFGARWTSPIDGQIEVTMSIRSLNVGGNRQTLTLNSTPENMGLLATYVVYPNGGWGDFQTVTMTIDISVGDKLDMLVYEEGSWGGNMAAYTYTITEVPEPATILLMSVGGIMCYIKRRSAR